MYGFLILANSAYSGSLFGGVPSMSVTHLQYTYNEVNYDIHAV